MSGALDTNSLPFESKKLHAPALQEVADALQAGLPQNFAEVQVEVVDCPDLTTAPFHLAAKGLGGNETILELGGVPYLLPLVDRTRTYDMKAICRRILANNDGYLAIGAGAANWNIKSCNAEGIYNFVADDKDEVHNQSHLVQVIGEDRKCRRENYPPAETGCSLLANIYVSEGRPGKVLRVHCKKRTGNLDYITSIRQVLTAHFKDEPVGLGGTFLLKEGAARQHVMQDFSKTPINREDELNTWLKFYEMPAPLVAVGTLMTQDFGLDLRLQHFHSFSPTTWGGHYHNDVTPDSVEYLGYFNVGRTIHRVDRPTVTHQFGRD